MKRSIVSVIIALPVLLAVITLSGCALSSLDEEHSSKTPSTPETPAYSKELWGEWLRMDAEETWYIRSTAISINNTASSRRVSLSKQSDRVIEVTEGGRKYYLYASRVANTSFTGRVATLEQNARSARAVGGIGGIGVTISNLKDKANETNATTNADGSFTAEGIIPGEDYVVTPEGGQPTTVTPTADGDDIGTITITEGTMNFKTSISAGTTIRYPNVRHDFTLRIKNTGTEDCRAATFQLDFDSELQVIAVPVSSILGTIEPGAEKSIPITVMCNPFSSEYEFRKIGVKITDTRSNNIWNDSVSIKFSNEKESYRIKFNIRADSAVSGMIITPNSGAFRFNKTTSESLSIPWSPQDYLIVLSGATADTEAVYSFAVNVTPDTNFSSLQNPVNYEPNDTETATTVISMQDSIMSYLDKNDIDYYKINFPLPGLSELYVSSNGSNANNGETPEEPLATVSRALELIRMSRNTYSPMSIVISGSIGENIDLRGSDYPPIELRGNSTANSSIGRLIIGNNKVTLDENLIICGGVEVGGGTFTMMGGEISGNTAYGDIDSSGRGGGVYISGGTFTMAGGKISGNIAFGGSGRGGGVYVGGTFTMIGGTISGNHASSGGGVCVYIGSFTMSGGAISGNTASQSSSYGDGGGGGVSVLNGSFTMSGGTISGNSSRGGGGGVYVSNSGTFTKQSGGTIYGSDAEVALKNTTTSGDTSGHAVYASSRKRNTTAGEGVWLDSTKSGTAGGWE